MRKILNNLDANWSLLLLPFLPLLLIIGLILIVVIVVIFLALWITVGLSFILGLIIMFAMLFLLATKRIPPMIAALFIFLALIMMLLSITGIFEITYIETTFQSFPNFDIYGGSLP